MNFDEISPSPSWVVNRKASIMELLGKPTVEVLRPRPFIFNELEKISESSPSESVSDLSVSPQEKETEKKSVIECTDLIKEESNVLPPSWISTGSTNFTELSNDERIQNVPCRLIRLGVTTASIAYFDGKDLHTRTAGDGESGATRKKHSLLCVAAHGTSYPHQQLIETLFEDPAKEEHPSKPCFEALSLATENIPDPTFPVPPPLAVGSAALHIAGRSLLDFNAGARFRRDPSARQSVASYIAQLFEIDRECNRKSAREHHGTSSAYPCTGVHQTSSTFNHHYPLLLIHPSWYSKAEQETLRSFALKELGVCNTIGKEGISDEDDRRKDIHCISRMHAIVEMCRGQNLFHQNTKYARGVTLILHIGGTNIEALVLTPHRVENREHSGDASTQKGENFDWDMALSRIVCLRGVGSATVDREIIKVLRPLDPKWSSIEPSALECERTSPLSMSDSRVASETQPSIREAVHRCALLCHSRNMKEILSLDCTSCTSTGVDSELAPLTGVCTGQTTLTAQNLDLIVEAVLVPSVDRVIGEALREANVPPVASSVRNIVVTGGGCHLAALRKHICKSFAHIQVNWDNDGDMVLEGGWRYWARKSAQILTDTPYDALIASTMSRKLLQLTREWYANGVQSSRILSKKQNSTSWRIESNVQVDAKRSSSRGVSNRSNSSETYVYTEQNATEISHLIHITPACSPRGWRSSSLHRKSGLAPGPQRTSSGGETTVPIQSSRNAGASQTVVSFLNSLPDVDPVRACVSQMSIRYEDPTYYAAGEDGLLVPILTTHSENEPMTNGVIMKLKPANQRTENSVYVRLYRSCPRAPSSTRLSSEDEDPICRSSDDFIVCVGGVGLTYTPWSEFVVVELTATATQLTYARMWPFGASMHDPCSTWDVISRPCKSSGIVGNDGSDARGDSPPILVIEAGTTPMRLKPVHLNQEASPKFIGDSTPLEASQLNQAAEPHVEERELLPNAISVARDIVKLHHIELNWPSYRDLLQKVTVPTPLAEHS